MRKLLALVMSLTMTTPAFAMGAWDGLKEQGKVWDTGTDHPLSTSQNASAHSLAVVANPIYQALTYGWEGQVAWQELQGFWFVPYGMVVGAWLEHRTNPRKFGKFEHNGHVVTGEGAKWERDPDHVGWNRLVRYDTFGPGSDKTKDYFSAIDRIGG